MFIHVVLFVVKPGELAKYRKDSLMWARHARKTCGLLSYRTMRRLGYKDQYASVYQWARKSDHDRFMRKYHDWLVDKSKAKVKVVEYYNLKRIDKFK